MCGAEGKKNGVFVPVLLEDSGVKREWGKREEVELLGVANFGISFKLLASLPFLLSKEENSKKKMYLFWPAWGTTPFALEESESLHPQLQKPKTRKLLGEKFPDTFSQFLSYCWKSQEPSGEQRGYFCKWQNTC